MDHEVLAYQYERIRTLEKQNARLLQQIARLDAGSVVADRFYSALQAAEVGRNDFGPYWRTSELVAAVRAFLQDYR